MITVDNLLLQIVNCSSPSVDSLVSKKDFKVLTSLASSSNSFLFITESQSNLLLKILNDNKEKLAVIENNIAKILATPEWSRPFRKIEQVRKLSIVKNLEEEYVLQLEITPSGKIRKILMDANKVIENLIQLPAGKYYQADLTEKNIVLLVNLLTPFNFDISENVKNHYETIKSWSETEIRNQLLLTKIEHPNFHKAITSDLGIETAIDQNIINDRSMRYQYFTENAKNPGENLVEYLSNRPSTRIWVDKNQHTLTEVVESLIHLRRLPLLVVFDGNATTKFQENLENLSEALENNGIFDHVGVYFRLANDDAGKQFNSFIQSKSYNYKLDDTTIVASLLGGKMPKFFLKNAWKPMSVIALDTRMGMRHGKTSVYASCCDLIIEYADQPTILEQSKLQTWQ
jgi:hypothetical protein